ncbi:MAG: DinB family protein [Chitinophagales bacterium]
MANNIKTQYFLQELNAEYKATRACLEKIPETTFEFKPHPKSMSMGYLVLLVAEIPLWIKHMVTDGEIDFVTFKHFTPKTTKELVDHFEENMEAARKALKETNDEALQAPFTLKANGQVLYSAPKIADIGATLNHWVHHRGQLTVYMRLNEIPVPSIYGPSADDKQFAPSK